METLTLTRVECDALLAAGPGPADISRVLSMEIMRSQISRGELSSDDVLDRGEVLGLKGPPNPRDAAMLDAPEWPIPLALAWISTRDPIDALRQWRVFRWFGQPAWRLLGWSATAQGICQKLAAGKLKSTGVSASEGTRMPVPDYQWLDLRLDSADWSGAVCFYDCAMTLAFTEVRVRRSQLQAIWPAANARHRTTARDESECRRELRKIMSQNPDRKSLKGEIRKRFPNMPEAAFNRAWGEVGKGFPVWIARGRAPKELAPSSTAEETAEGPS